MVKMHPKRLFLNKCGYVVFTHILTILILSFSLGYSGNFAYIFKGDCESWKQLELQDWKCMKITEMASITMSLLKGKVAKDGFVKYSFIHTWLNQVCRSIRFLSKSWNVM